MARDETAAMSGAENLAKNEDTNQSKMVAGWLWDGEVFEDYILMEPDYELGQHISIRCVHGRTFNLICNRKYRSHAEDVHFTHERRLE